MFIIDEAYVNFCTSLLENGGGINSNSCSYLAEKYNNIAVVKTFSKFFSLAGLRLGYVVYKNARFLDPYSNQKDITGIAIAAGIACLKNIDYYIRAYKTLESTKAYLGE
jgi:histidinol-phosphate aminotransferase